MKSETEELIKIFGLTNTDWMGYIIKRKQDITFHHLQKKVDGGLYEINNGALLNGSTAHPYLHLIEAKDFDMYEYINNILKNINAQRFNPTHRQLLAIHAILEQFEREHCGDRTKKGRPLIKPEYVERRIKL